MSVTSVAPGVWRVRLGEPEAHGPVSLRHTTPAVDALSAMPEVAECPVEQALICGTHSARGFHLTLPLAANEQLYGLGLQLKSMNQRGKKKTLRVNSDPTADLGDSHAPVPFYVSNAGYGVLVDTARYATFYCGSAKKVRNGSRGQETVQEAGSLSADPDDRPEYAGQDSGSVDVDIPSAVGADIYIFAGPTLLDAVRRYNLFSGSGPLVPRWGLGVWYRPEAKMNAVEVTELAEDLRETQMPCDVIGLEPGWQTRSYSCSFVWSDKFPDPAEFVSGLRDRHFQVNLWTHAFTHPESPVYDDLKEFAGDYEIWNGIVPDLTIAKARQAFGGIHERLHVDGGVSGYKLDECDNSDFISSPWSFPELSQFPSGLDGEQYHSVFGLQYQETIGRIFADRDRRTYGLVRNSHALAASYPFVLYSDLYAHSDFIRGLVNCGFSGLLWSPEVRHAVSEDDLIRRLQAVVFSPMALINAWYIPMPPWKQWRTAENNKREVLENCEDLTSRCRTILNLRMQLIPYLYAAFADYHLYGTPPFRALVMDYPDDSATFGIDDQFMVGDRLLVAPLTAEHERRDVYLPEGAWRDFWTGDVISGGRMHSVEGDLSRIPVYVKDSSVLPLATPTGSVEDPRSFELTVHVYGNGALPCTLFEDDGETFGFDRGEYNRATIGWDGGAVTVRRAGDYDGQIYSVIGHVLHAD